MPKHRAPVGGRAAADRAGRSGSRACGRRGVADWFEESSLAALLSVLLIDLVLAGDNAVVVGMAAAGLPRSLQARAVVLGIAAAAVLRILFALMAASILAIIGMTLAGGVLLAWVCWKFYRELCSGQSEAQIECGHLRPCKTLAQSLTQIVLADVSMSLDNVLAVAGAARDHSWVLVVGLILSVGLTGLASAVIARLLASHRWIAWAGLAMILLVAVDMIWRGSHEVMEAMT